MGAPESRGHSDRSEAAMRSVTRAVAWVTTLALVAALGAGAAALADQSRAGASAGSRAAAAAGQGRLTMGVKVLRFRARGRQLIARGRVTASLTDNAGHTKTIHDTVTLSAKTGGSCRVLHLRLDQLNLQLLGLTAHLDRVILDVTGKRSGVLGRLFCKLARAKVATASAARRLTVAMNRSGNQALRLQAYLTPQVAHSSGTAAASPTCPVLDLIVGPLDLELLGLVVDLNKVHLKVVATRGGGKLGDLFCQLADQPVTTTAGG